ncbi:MAG: hypothetical protein KKF48_05805 [Nanoarchaeota archaeon]|nr:hypothetical protein [Nanoarchaeota archaeon]
MALVVTPLYPLEGEEVTLSLTATTGNVVVYQITAVPSASAVATGLVLTDVPSSEETPTDATDAIERGYNTDTFTPDVAGEYSITAYDMLEMLGSPSYPGDPSGDHVYLLQATQTGTVYVGVAMDLPILTGDGRGGTLQLNVVDETIRAADIVNTTDEWARVAVLGAGVQANLAALVGVAVNTIGNDLPTAVNNLLTNYEAHRILTAGPVHVGRDDTNVVLRTVAHSVEGAVVLLNALYDAIVGHMELGTMSPIDWHAVGEDDYANLPVAARAATLASATVLCADLRERCYESHRIQCVASVAPHCHGIADVVNVLTAPTALDNIITIYLDELATDAPVAIAGESEGAADARQRYGFE